MPLVFRQGGKVQGAGFRVQGAGFRVQGAGCRVLGSGFRVQGAGFRVPGQDFLSAPPRMALLGRDRRQIRRLKPGRTAVRL